MVKSRIARIRFRRNGFPENVTGDNVVRRSRHRGATVAGSAYPAKKGICLSERATGGVRVSFRIDSVLTSTQVAMR